MYDHCAHARFESAFRESATSTHNTHTPEQTHSHSPSAVSFRLLGLRLRRENSTPSLHLHLLIRPEIRPVRREHAPVPPRPREVLEPGQRTTMFSHSRVQRGVTLAVSCGSRGVCARWIARPIKRRLGRAAAPCTGGAVAHRGDARLWRAADGSQEEGVTEGSRTLTHLPTSSRCVLGPDVFEGEGCVCVTRPA